MNILIVSQYFWPENFRINDLSLNLIKNGHEVTVLTGQPNYPEGFFFKNYGGFKKNKDKYYDVNIIRVPLIPRGNGNGVRLLLNYFSFAISAGILGPFLCKREFDVIFVYEPSPVTVGLPAIVMKKYLRIPMLFWVQDLWPETLSAIGKVKSKRSLKLIGLMVRYIYSYCDRVLIQSESFRSSIEKYIKKPEKIQYFPNSAEKLYRPLSRKGLPEDRSLPSGFRVMFAGNIGTAQGFDTILDTVELLIGYKEIHWIIIGDGRLYPWIKKEIFERRLEKVVHLLGKKNIESMPHFFSLADVLLVSLKKDPVFALTIPAKLQSYLACSKPIIASLEGAGAQIIEESNAGIACSPGNSEELASAILAMYKMPEEKRLKMGENGRKYFKAFFEGQMLVDRLEMWMKEAVGNNTT